MCGISGCVSFDGSAMEIVVRALNRLQNRGYDSCGICTIVDEKLIIKKSIGDKNNNAVNVINADNLSKITTCCAMGHTRWATHGARTEINAHPHVDNDNKYAIIHNGIIENYSELRNKLVNIGYKFKSETDTEVIVNYIDNLIKNSGSIRDIADYMEGSWAILIMDITCPNKIYYLKSGSPMLIGKSLGSQKIQIVSELSGFDNDIIEYTVISDGSYGWIEKTNDRCHHVSVNSTVKYIKMDRSEIELSPYPYPHWTIKEINDQPNAITSLLSSRLTYNYDNSFQLEFPEFYQYKNEITNAEHIIFLGCGTSYHAAKIGSYYFKELELDVTMEVIDGADFEPYDIPNKPTIMILLSQSGETRDLYRALEIGKLKGVLTVGIINVENSLISREVDCCLYLKAGREHAVASTKSFTNQVVMLLMIAIKMSNKKYDELVEYYKSLDRLFKDLTYTIDKTNEYINDAINIFTDRKSCFILGKHINEWIAKEGSLKIKEISYIHSEGYSAAALKHGPFALLDEKMPVVLLANNDIYYPKIDNAKSEIKSRLASIIYITNKVINDSSSIDLMMYYDIQSKLFPLISIIPLQIMAYHLSINRGCNPDYPRNLAKVVTVE